MNICRIRSPVFSSGPLQKHLKLGYGQHCTSGQYNTEGSTSRYSWRRASYRQEVYCRVVVVKTSEQRPFLPVNKSASLPCCWYWTRARGWRCGPGKRSNKEYRHYRCGGRVILDQLMVAANILCIYLSIFFY